MTQATQAAQSALERAGLRVLRSFELGGARGGRARAVPDGSIDCACAFAVLLVYPASGPPAAVTSYAEGNRTRFEIVLDPNAATDASLVGQVLIALGSAAGVEQGSLPPVDGA